MKLTQPTAHVEQHDTQAGRIPLIAGDQVGLPFLAIHYQTAWDYDDEHGFLPRVQQTIGREGCNGVTWNKRTQALDYSRARAKVAKKGGVCIETTDTRLGEFMHYLVSYPTANGSPDGGKWFCWKWETVRVLANGTKVWEEAPGSSARFRAHLRDHGIVGPMLAEVYAKLREHETKRLERFADRMGTNAHLAAKYEAQLKRLAAMAEAWDAYCASFDEPAPKKAGRRKKPAAPAPTAEAIG